MSCHLHVDQIFDRHRVCRQTEKQFNKANSLGVGKTTESYKRNSRMSCCKIVKVLGVIRKSVELSLGIGFLALSILALKDLLSNETTRLISRKYRNVSLPSLTICPYAYNTTFFNATSLANGAMLNLKFPLSVEVHMQSKTDGRITYVDLQNSSHLSKYFDTSVEDTWNLHCKIYPTVTNLNSCMPCIIFRNPDIQNPNIEILIVSIMFKILKLRYN